MRYWILRWQEDNWMIVCQQHIPIVGGSYRSKGFKGLLRQIAGNWMWICPTVVFVAFNHIQLRQSYNAWWVPCLWWILNACWLVFDGLRLAIRFWTSARYSGLFFAEFLLPQRHGSWTFAFVLAEHASCRRGRWPGRRARAGPRWDDSWQWENLIDGTEGGA